MGECILAGHGGSGSYTTVWEYTVPANVSHNTILGTIPIDMSACREIIVSLDGVRATISGSDSGYSMAFDFADMPIVTLGSTSDSNITAGSSTWIMKKGALGSAFSLVFGSISAGSSSIQTYSSQYTYTVRAINNPTIKFSAANSYTLAAGARIKVEVLYL